MIGIKHTSSTHGLSDFAKMERDIERICRESSEKPGSPEVFLLTIESVTGALLAVDLQFLEQGQLLTCPGLPLVGAVFDPGWGFSHVEIAFSSDGTVIFKAPSRQFDTGGVGGDTYGFRLCPVDAHEIPSLIGQLAAIRQELARPKHQPVENGMHMTITEL